jgi:hypothetical protein
MPSAVDALTRYADAIATARTFAARAGALRVVLLIDQGADAHPVMVDCAGDGAVELVADGGAWTLPATADLPALPRALPDVRATPASAISVDPDAGRVSAPIGVVRQLADGLLALARASGGRSVATAEFATDRPELPISLAARDGEPLVLSAGEYQFELPESA